MTSSPDIVFAKRIVTEATRGLFDLMRAANGGTIEGVRRLVRNALAGIAIARGAEPEGLSDLVADLASARAPAILVAEFVTEDAPISTG